MTRRLPAAPPIWRPGLPSEPRGADAKVWVGRVARVALDRDRRGTVPDRQPPKDRGPGGTPTFLRCQLARTRCHCVPSRHPPLGPESSGRLNRRPKF